MKNKYFRILLFMIISLFAVVILSNEVIDYNTRGKTFNSINKIPKNRVGIILGTSKKLVGGSSNLYYANRIDATLTLYFADKIEYILVSGDNGTKYYNEPKTIKKDLIAGGIPEEKIFLDYAGFRTLDSMVRAKEVFGLEKATVISQEFHNARAIYLAEKKGLTAIGYNATDVTGNSGSKVHLREYLARVKVFIDLIFNTQPKFYGEPIVIE